MMFYSLTLFPHKYMCNMCAVCKLIGKACYDGTTGKKKREKFRQCTLQIIYVPKMLGLPQDIKWPWCSALEG